MKTPSNRTRRFISIPTSPYALMLFMAAKSAFADNFWEGDTSIDWNDPLNWSADTYPGATNAIVNPNAGTFPDPTISANATTVNDIRINDTGAGTATVNQTAGAITQTGWFRIATGGGGTGIFNMSGGTQTITGGRVLIGESGTGVVNISGGTINASGGEGFMLAANGGSTGTVNQTGGVVNKTNGWFSIGANGNGYYNISGGSLSATGDFNVADVGSSTGELNVSGTALVTSTGTLFVGKNSGTTGFINVSGGTVNSAFLTLGRTGGAANVGNGFVTVTGGQLNSTGEIWVGGGNGGANALMDLSAGTVSAGSWIAVGREANSYGVLNVRGTSTIRMTGGSGAHFIIGSLGGVGVLNMTGGTLEATNGGDLRISEAGPGSGTANLGGGIVMVDHISDNGGSSYLYLNGSTLKSRISTTTFLQGIDTTTVGANGAIFDTDGKNITVNQTLNAPINDGVNSIVVIDGGSGYRAQPILKVTGDGTGASAIANMTGGVITSVTITNPGINYTFASVSLVDGGATTTATLDVPIIALNVTTGGLTKLGNGTLALGSTGNDYLGATTISGGMISVADIFDGGSASTLGASSSAATNLVFDGGGLQYTGTGFFNNSTNRNFTINTGKTATIDVTTPGVGAALHLTGGSAATNGALTKIGNGTLSLEGTYAHTGLTSVNGGVLAASGVYTGGGFAVNAGGHLTAQFLTEGTLTVPSLVLNTGGAVDIEFGFGAGLNTLHDIITVSNSGGLSIGSTGLYLYQTGGTSPFADNGTYTLFDYNTSFTGSLSQFTIANSQVGKLYNLTNNLGATTIELSIADTVITAWANSGGGPWTTAANWTGAVPNSFGAIATFGSAITAPSTVTVDGSKTVGVITFDNLNAYTLSGGAGDTITLNNGSGTPLIQQLSGDHTIAAPLVLIAATNVSPAAGTTLTISGVISGAGLLNINDVGTVVLTAANTHAGSGVSGGTLSVGDGGTLGSLGSGPVLTGTGGTLAFNRSDAISIANTISGTGSVAKNGAGALTYTGSATYTGSTTLNTGTFFQEGTINGTNSFDIEVPAVFRLSSSTTINGPLLIANAGSSTASLDLQGSATVVATGPVRVANGFGSTATLNVSGTTSLSAGDLFVGNVGTGIANITSGSVTSNGNYVGATNGSSGMVNLSGGTLTTNQWTVVGDNNGSTGVVAQTGGKWNQNHTDWLSVGQNGNGTYTMSGNSVLNDPAAVDTSVRGTNKGNVVVGRWGTGVGLWTLTDNAVAHIRELLVGNDAGSNGQVDINGNALVDSSYDFHIGRAGVGVVNINGGTLNTTSGWTQIGIDSGGNGTLNVTAGSVSSREYLVGGNSTGTVNVSGGTLTATQRFTLGDGAAGLGYLNVSGTGLTLFQNSLDVGRNGFGSAVISGGTVTITNGFNMGNFASAQGYVTQTNGAVGSAGGGEWRIGGSDGAAGAAVGIYNLSGGTFSTGQNFQIGAFGSGQMNVSGTGAVTVTGGFPSVGRFVGGFGVLDVSSGGSFTENSGNLLIVGEEGTGTLNVRGGTVTLNSPSTSIAVSVGHQPSGNGTVNLLSGTLSTLSIGTGNVSAISTLNFNGGTLRANGSNPTFVQGLTNAYVYAGGGVIDTQAHTVTIAQDLLAPTGGGVSNIPVAGGGGGSGYQSAPIVILTGGDGTGATAIATLNGLGEVSDIIITNPGVGYTVAPSATLVGGAPAVVATLDPVALAANTSGTLTKNGTGTLSLDGTQGYNTLHATDGTTNVNGVFTSPTATVNADADVNFGVSETLFALNIGNGAVVSVGPGPAPELGFTSEFGKGSSASAVVPEPGTLGLLLVSSLGILARRRRR